MKNLLGVLVVLSNWHYFAQMNADYNQIHQQKDLTAVFEENKGQMKDQFWNPRPDVLYYGTTEGMNYYIKNSGMSYQLSRIESWKDEEGSMQHFQDGAQDCKQVPDQIGTYRVDAEWLNSNPDFEVIQGKVLDGYNNYYNVPEGVEPVLFVKKYETLTLKNVWEGIDLHYYGTNGFLETDYLVAPGADYQKIQIQFKGAELSTDDSGNLIIKTPFGEIQEGALKVYQNNERIEAYWSISEDNVVSFEIPNYNSDFALRIDPLTRVWGTYYGGSGSDCGNYVKSDTQGNVYLAGYTTSTSGIAFGGYQNILEGDDDAFLVKFNSAGQRLWATYYGGTGYDEAYSLDINVAGEIYLSGGTNSTDFPLYNLSSAYNQSTKGGEIDAFLIKLSPIGIPIWATYYGGSYNDVGYKLPIILDSDGNLFMASMTGSLDFPLQNLSGAYNQSVAVTSGIVDAYLVKFSPSGALLWATRYGGGGNDQTNSLAVDSLGNIYMTGTTASSDFPLQNLPGAFNQSFWSGGSEAFIVKFSSSGERLWSTYFGGSNEENIFSVSIDTSGSLYLSGATNSIDFPVKNYAGAYNQAQFAGDLDGFIAKFSPSGEELWCSYYGGSAQDRALTIAIDVSGNIYMAGNTFSTDLPLQSQIGAYYQGLTEAFNDAYLVQFSSDGALQWATYYGGTGFDEAYSLEIDVSSDVYMGGRTYATNFPVQNQVGAFNQVAFAGVNDAFLVKFSETQNIFGLTKITTKSIKVFPNPASGFVTIESIEPWNNESFEIYDQSGRKLLSGLLSGAQNTVQLPFESGIYFLKIRNDVLKIIEQ